MKMEKIINKVIEEVLTENDQPYVEEFKTFIEHVLMGNYSDDEILERIRAIKIKEEK